MPSTDVDLDLTARPSSQAFVLEVRGTMGPGGVSRLREALEEIEMERYGNVELDLQGLTGIGLETVAQLLGSAARSRARGIAFRVSPEIPLLQLGALSSFFAELWIGRRDLFEVHRLATLDVLVPDPSGGASRRSGIGKEMLRHERRIRRAARDIAEAALQFQTEPLLLLTHDKEAERAAWCEFGPVVSASERADRELQARFAELAGISPKLRTANEGLAGALTGSIAVAGSLRHLVDERLRALR